MSTNHHATAPDTTYEPQGLPSYQIALDYRDGRSIGSRDTLLTLDLETGKITLASSRYRGWYVTERSPRQYYGVERAWALRSTTDAEALEEALTDPASPIRVALGRIYRGSGALGDGSCQYGYLDNDALLADYELRRLLTNLPSTRWKAREAREWLTVAPDWLDVDTNDYELPERIPALESAAASVHVVLWGSLLEVLQELRSGLDEDEEDEEV